MKLLLDTHVLIWWVLASPRLSPKAQAALADFDNDVSVSAATVCEIATKYSLGKLPEVESYVQTLPDRLHKLGFQELPVSVSHAHRRACFPLSIKIRLTGCRSPRRRRRICCW